MIENMGKWRFVGQVAPCTLHRTRWTQSCKCMVCSSDLHGFLSHFGNQGDGEREVVGDSGTMWDPNGQNMTKPSVFMLHQGSEEACVAQSALLMGSAQVLHETSLALGTLSGFTVPTVTLEVLPKVVTWWHSRRYKQVQMHKPDIFMYFLS